MGRSNKARQTDDEVISWLESLATMGTIQSPGINDYTQQSATPSVKLARLVAGMAPNPLRRCTETQQKLYTTYLVGRKDYPVSVVSSTGHSVTTDTQSAPVTRKDVATWAGMTVRQLDAALSRIRSVVSQTIAMDGGMMSKRRPAGSTSSMSL